MSRLGEAVRNHRNSARARREITQAMDHASRSVRDELRTMAQAQGIWLR